MLKDQNATPVEEEANVISAPEKPEPKPKPEETVDITFDFGKLGLFEVLDMIEYSAKRADKATAVDEDPKDVLKFIGAVRRSYVSSSRPLTGNDFIEFLQGFWKQFNLRQSNPN